MASGVRIKEVIIGSGAIAEDNKVAVVHYRSFLNRGEELSNTRTSGQPARIHLGKRDVIPGLEQGIVGMREGGSRELEISPHLAYGEQGVPGRIPPQAVLRFEVQLLEVREPGVAKPEDYPPGKQLIIRRAGEAKRGAMEWHFGLKETGDMGVSFKKCPPPGATWRHARQHQIDGRLDLEKTAAVFADVAAFVTDHQKSLLDSSGVWADASEKANSMPRDSKTDAPCIWVAVYERGNVLYSFYLPETSPLLMDAFFYRVVEEFVSQIP